MEFCCSTLSKSNIEYKGVRKGDAYSLKVCLGRPVISIEVSFFKMCLTSVRNDSWFLCLFAHSCAISPQP